jgi:alpha-D-ribose 1-methylphosphonate 5-triphosphate diphosphatase
MKTQFAAPDFTIKNAKIVTANEVVHGSLQVWDGFIARIDEGSDTSSGQEIDLEGDYLIPGLVEVNSRNLYNHNSPDPGIAWPVLPSILAHDAQITAAGITTVLDSLSLGFGNASVHGYDVFEEILNSLETAHSLHLLRAEHLLHFRVELPHPYSIRYFETVLQTPNVRLVSLMDHTLGQRQWRKQYAAVPNHADPEFETKLQRSRQIQSIYAEPHRQTVLEMLVDAPFAIASHDDTTEQHVEQAHLEKIGICGFPTTITAAVTARKHGMKIIAGAPNMVLGRSRFGNVSVAELAGHGLLDVLSSDNVPCSLLNGAFLLHQKVGMPLVDAIRTVTSAPAELIGLQDRGSISIGKRADMLRVALVDDLPVVRSVWRAGKLILQ